MGIVHGAASYLPDLVDYMADHYPTLIVKTGSLASRDNHTTTMSQYRDEVIENCLQKYFKNIFVYRVFFLSGLQNVL